MLLKCSIYCYHVGYVQLTNEPMVIQIKLWTSNIGKQVENWPTETEDSQVRTVHCE
jgi:hypothetical protein